MAKKRKSSFLDVAVGMINQLHSLSTEAEADFDAIARAAKEVATAAGLRTPTKRRKTLDQMIVEREARQAAKEAAAKVKAEKAKARKAAKLRRAARAEKPGKE